MPAVSAHVDRAGLARDLDRHFPDLVRAHQDGIFSGVFRLVPGRADAEDVTQETFVRAYRALQNYDEDRIRSLRVEPWLWTIALNLCRNAARGRARKPVAPLEGVAEQADSTDTAAEALDAVASAEWRRRLTALPSPVRSAVVLRHVVGLGYAEISEALGRPAGTVKSDVHRGLARLQTMLIQEREEEA